MTDISKAMNYAQLVALREAIQTRMEHLEKRDRKACQEPLMPDWYEEVQRWQRHSDEPYFVNPETPCR